MTDSNLAALIAGAQAGRPEAFDALVDAFADRLYGYLYRLCGSHAEAEDLLQEMFLRLVRAIARYEHRNNFEAFLFRIATNLFRDRCRRQKHTGPICSLDMREEEDSPRPPVADTRMESPAYRLQREEDADKLQAALAELAPAEKEVIMLRHFSNLSFKEIASAMNTPLGTALARAHRGLAKLRGLVEEM